jgi:hypothetical protein
LPSKRRSCVHTAQQIRASLFASPTAAWFEWRSVDDFPTAHSCSLVSGLPALRCVSAAVSAERAPWISSVLR